MHIHFVCRGNTYRSRLADAYCNSKNIPGLQATSSGTHAEHNENGAISWVSAFLLRRHAMQRHLSALSWAQTNKYVIEAADLVVFMDKDAEDNAKTLFDALPQKSITLNISDFAAYNMTTDEEIIGMINVAEETFSLVRKNVDEIIGEMS